MTTAGIHVISFLFLSLPRNNAHQIPDLNLDRYRGGQGAVASWRMWSEGESSQRESCESVGGKEEIGENSSIHGARFFSVGDGGWRRDDGIDSYVVRINPSTCSGASASVIVGSLDNYGEKMKQIKKHLLSPTIISSVTCVAVEKDLGRGPAPRPVLRANVQEDGCEEVPSTQGQLRIGSCVNAGGLSVEGVGEERADGAVADGWFASRKSALQCGHVPWEL
ncbi:hypothetical protein B0H14DRAFT_2640146 [Mycena olivaceomarginata]|nr:hypothetical protein B0H14DRAFT_2640146 [Mycena olivaceomarginata]